MGFLGLRVRVECCLRRVVTVGPGAKGLASLCFPICDHGVAISLSPGNTVCVRQGYTSRAPRTNAEHQLFAFIINFKPLPLTHPPGLPYRKPAFLGLLRL